MLKRIWNTFRKFWLGDRRWGCLVRLGFVLVSFYLLTRFAHAIFPAGSIDHLVQTWIDRQRGFKIIPRRFLRFLGLFALDYRFLWLALWGFLTPLLLSASYLQTIFNIPKLRHTVRYLAASFFGFKYPSVVINQGRLQVKEDETNLVRDIGGPGWVIVQPGNVPVFEYLHKPSRIVANGVHFLSRFERIKRFESDFALHGYEIPTIDDRHGYIERVAATTKDGITLVVEDIHYRYRLRLGRAYGDFANRDPRNPNPFSVEAVRKMAYNRTVRVSDPETGETELTTWHSMINIAVDGAITDYIREHRFNDVVVPLHPDDPRQEITEKLFSRGVRSRLKNNGADLLWSDIGHFRVEDPLVADQLVENWGTVWSGEASIRHAMGEARRIELLERGRAEAQAEMLIQIMEAFENMDVQGDPRENLANLLLARTAQILEGMKDRNENSDRSQFPPTIET